MAGMAAKMLMRGAGKMGNLASKVPGLQSKLGGLGGAALGGAGAAGVMGVPGIPAGPGMQGAVGAPVTERVYIGSIHKRIYWPGTRGEPLPEEPQREPLPEEPQRQWTPTTVTSSFTGMAGAAAVAGGSVVAVSKAPGLFATWAPTVIFVIGILIILGMVIYYTFYHKKAVKEAGDDIVKEADEVGDEAKKGAKAIKGEARKLK